MHRFTLRVAGWLALFAVVGALRATTIIYPVDAIDDFWTANSEEFRKKYAGIVATGLGPSDEGWYVRYRHENLTCLFGPLADREEARKKKWDMEAVRDAAIRNRATLSSSQVDFVRFTFSGAFGRRGGGGGGAGTDAMGRVSADGKSGPDGDLDGDGIPNSKDDDMDGDGIPNALDPDSDGDGIPNAQDDYAFGSMDDKIRGGPANAGGSQDGPDGDLDGDGIPNAKDNDMDGDGIPNDQDPDADGDGVPNAEDPTPYGKTNGQGAGADGRTAGKSGNRAGGSGSEADGEGGDSGGGQQASAGGQRGQKQVASNQRGQQPGQSSGQQSGSSGQSGQSGQQSGQSGSQSSSQGGAQGGGQSGGPPSGSSGGGGNPLSLVSALLKAILGL